MSVPVVCPSFGYCHWFFEILLKTEFTTLGSTGLATSFFTRLFIVFARLQKFQDPFTLHFLFQAFQSSFNWLMLANIHF